MLIITNIPEFDTPTNPLIYKTIYQYLANNSKSIFRISNLSIFFIVNLSLGGPSSRSPPTLRHHCEIHVNN